MVSLTRRKTLKTIGVGAVIGLATGPGSAAAKARVFVHPDGDQSQAEQALRDHGGSVLIVYDNWDFVAGIVPSDNRRDLENDDRVERVGDDSRIHAIHHKDGHDGGPGDGGVEMTMVDVATIPRKTIRGDTTE